MEKKYLVKYELSLQLKNFIIVDFRELRNPVIETIKKYLRKRTDRFNKKSNLYLELNLLELQLALIKDRKTQDDFIKTNGA